MQRRELNLRLNWILLVAALTTFSTGLVLLLCFHLGHGALATSALGLGKLIWLNLHRILATVAALGVVTHLGLHWRVFRSRLTNIFTKRRRRLVNSEMIMYPVFFISVSSGFIAWLVLEVSSPLFGPAVIGPASSTGHHWIDTHHLSSLVSLVLVVHHVGHRWRPMVRLRKTIAVQPEK